MLSSIPSALQAAAANNKCLFLSNLAPHIDAIHTSIPVHVHIVSHFATTSESKGYQYSFPPHYQQKNRRNFSSLHHSVMLQTLQIVCERLFPHPLGLLTFSFASFFLLLILLLFLRDRQTDSAQLFPLAWMVRFSGSGGRGWIPFRNNKWITISWLLLSFRKTLRLCCKRSEVRAKKCNCSTWSFLARAPGPSRVQGIARCKDVPSSGVEFDSLYKFIIEKRKTLEDVQSHPTARYPEKSEWCRIIFLPVCSWLASLTATTGNSSLLSGKKPSPSAAEVGTDVGPPVPWGQVSWSMCFLASTAE